MATLSGNTIASTFGLLLKIDSTGLDGTLREVEDGDATASPLFLSTADVAVDNGSGLIIGSTTVQETVSIGDGSTDLVPELQVLGTAAADSSMLLGAWSTTATTAGAPNLCFVKGGNATIGSHTVVTDGEELGNIIAFGDDGTDLEAPAAMIQFEVDGTPGTGDMPGRIIFATTTDDGETLTERMRIDAAGDMTLTSATASKPILHITNTHAGATAGEIRFNKDSASGDDNDVMGTISWYGTDAGEATHERLAYMDTIITDSAAGSEAASMRFYVAENDATLTQGLALAGQADADGEVDVTIGAGASSTATIAGDLSVVGDVIMADGKGIDFSANTDDAGGMTAELLDDYEEGTWTGTFNPASGSFGQSMNTGSYTKVGRLVTICGLLTINSETAASGHLTITGLPFAAGSGNEYKTSVSLWPNGLGANKIIHMVGEIAGGATKIDVFRGDSASITTDAASDLDAACDMRFNATYFV